MISEIIQIECPQTLIITEECLAYTHGTGANLLRVFDGPSRSKINAVHAFDRGEPLIENSHRAMLRTPSRSPHWLPSFRPQRRRETKQSYLGYRRWLQSTARNTKIIYANVCGIHGLRLLSEATKELPHAPVIFHAQDMLTGKTDFDEVLRGMADQIDEFWAIGPTAARDLGAIVQREVEIVNPFQVTIQPQYRTLHRRFGPDFRLVMSGNAYCIDVLVRVGQAWANLQSENPGLKPIDWFCHESAMLQLKKREVPLPTGIRHAGFVTPEQLHQEICASDAALVLFGDNDQPTTDYEKYSIPSRMTDYMNAGLPSFVVAGAQSDTARYVHNHGIGVVTAAKTVEEMLVPLRRFAMDVDQRSMYGQAARQHAIKHCDVDRYRIWLWTRFASAILKFRSDSRSRLVLPVGHHASSRLTVFLQGKPDVSSALEPPQKRRA